MEILTWTYSQNGVIIPPGGDAINNVAIEFTMNLTDAIATSYQFNVNDFTDTFTGPTYTWTPSGVRPYTVYFVGTTDNGIVTSESATVNVVNPNVIEGVIVPISADVDSGMTPLVVNLTADLSGLNYPADWMLWVPGNGDNWNKSIADGTTMSTIYNEPGTYVVEVSAVSWMPYVNNIGTKIITVIANPLAPIAAFSCSTPEIVANSNISLQDLSTGGVTSWIRSIFDINNNIVTSSTEQNPSIRLDSVGVYSVKLLAINEYGGNAITQEGIVTVTPNPIEATIDFTCTQNGVEILDGGTFMQGVPVIFTPIVTDGIAIGLYDFGNDTGGESFAGPTYTWIPPSAGIENIYIVSTTTNGWCYAMKSFTVISLGLAPVADFVAVPQRLVMAYNDVGTVQLFDNSTNNPTSRVWSISGVVGSSTEQNPVIEFGPFAREMNGIYTISVIMVASNAYGSNQIIKQNIIYLETHGATPTPIVEFQGDITTGPAPLTVHFMDISQNIPTKWLRDFGIGYTTTYQNPTIEFNIPGTYDVSLTAKNASGVSEYTVPSYITVTAPVGKTNLTMITQAVRGDRTFPPIIKSDVWEEKIVYGTKGEDTPAPIYE